MKKRPILFNGEMVRAILAGRKTQTRRVVKPQPHNPGLQAWLEEVSDGFIRSPYGVPGDRLWVRETWNCIETGIKTQRQDWVRYRATDGEELYWKPSIFMPRWASRITLTITGVRVERVQDISSDDCRAEGLTPDSEISLLWRENIRDKYRDLWNSINAKRGYGWDTNPWVWVISFEVQP